MPAPPPPTLGKAETKYLARHAEPEAQLASQLAEVGGPYGAVVVIPAYGEEASTLKTLESIPTCAGAKALVVLVVNQRSLCPDWARVANARLLAAVRETWPLPDGTIQIGQHAQLLCRETTDLLLIDRTQLGFELPKKQGVGLARKIGTDLAFALWSLGQIKTPWIHCTDADVLLPGDYWERIKSLPQTRPSKPGPSAVLYDFRHLRDDTPGRAHDQTIFEYELFLRYYVLGLHYAGSSYAMHTIGSTIAVNTRAYAQVRGFPKREAAEDFHLLSKLAKVGAVAPLRGAPIEISGRESLRVPFGTGNAVRLGRERSRTGEVYKVYDPRVFDWLGAWLDALACVAVNEGAKIEEAVENAARRRGLDAPTLKRILNSLSALEAIEKVLQNKGDRGRAFNQSFGALETLKLVHALRDEVHEDIPLAQALAQAEFVEVSETASLEEQCLVLADLERAADH